MRVAWVLALVQYVGRDPVADLDLAHRPVKRLTDGFVGLYRQNLYRAQVFGLRLRPETLGFFSLGDPPSPADVDRHQAAGRIDLLNHPLDIFVWWVLLRRGLHGQSRATARSLHLRVFLDEPFVFLQEVLV